MTDPNHSNFPDPESSGYEYEYPAQPPPPPAPPPVPPSVPPTPVARPTLPSAAPERVIPVPRPPSVQSVSRGAEYDAPRQSRTPLPQRPPAGGRWSGARNWAVRAIPFVIGIFLILVCGGLALVGGVYAFYAKDLPSADQLASVNTDQSTKIYDRNGGLLYEIVDPNLGRHTIIPPEKIPQVLKQATLATEDPSFYSNPGVDWYALARALYYLIRYQRPVSGASTITQQLMKTVFLSPEQTPERKIKEAILAVEVTRRYTKDQILAFYLNTINYGNRSYGIQAAAQSYFAEDVTKLDLAQASLLAGLPQLPAIYDPCLNPDKALERQGVVLGLMQEQGFVNAAQATAAGQEMTAYVASDEFVNRCKAGLNYTHAPHFVEYVRQELQAKYGPEFDRAGLQVYTTLDPQIQDIVEQEARKQIAALKDKNVSSAAVVVMNPRDGEIYAMLGSVDFNDANIDGQVNVATRLRQPGSSIKPLNYLAAFEKGWTPATPIYDMVTDFPNGSQPPYVPLNYDNKEHGLVTVRTALANSYNIPAVKTLYFVGVPEMMGVAQRFGITTFTDPSRYGLSLTLGGGGSQTYRTDGRIRGDCEWRRQHALDAVPENHIRHREHHLRYQCQRCHRTAADRPALCLSAHQYSFRQQCAHARLWRKFALEGVTPRLCQNGDDERLQGQLDARRHQRIGDWGVGWQSAQRSHEKCFGHHRRGAHLAQCVGTHVSRGGRVQKSRTARVSHSARSGAGGGVQRIGTDSERKLSGGPSAHRNLFEQSSPDAI